MAEPTLYMAANAAVSCQEHAGAGRWRVMPAESAARLRGELDRMGLVAAHEPLCETCREQFRRPELAAGLTGGDA